MDQVHQDLSRYRFCQAKEMLEDAKYNLAGGRYKTANNRAYYSIFHAIRAVLALDNLDFKKHSGVISRFNQDYLRTDIISRKYSSYIYEASAIRNFSDYEDMYICSKEETKELVAHAEEFLNAINVYLSSRYV